MSEKLIECGFVLPRDCQSTCVRSELLFHFDGYTAQDGDGAWCNLTTGVDTVEPITRYTVAVSPGLVPVAHRIGYRAARIAGQAALYQFCGGIAEIVTIERDEQVA